MLLQINDNDLVFAIIASALIFLLLVSLIVTFILLYQRRKQRYKSDMLNAKQKFEQELLKSQLETHEATLHQISEEIHDNIGQLLSSTKMLLGITGMNMDNAPDTLKTAETTLGKAIQDLRALSKSLNKEWLHQFNIVDNLKAETERINAAHTIQATYTSSTHFLPIPAEAQVMLFRIVQEALQNSIKHAQAQHISIETSFTNEHIAVTVEDDGIGINHEERPLTGVGILNMQHRTKLLGGTITWHTLPNGGTQVCITLPVQQHNI